MTKLLKVATAQFALAAFLAAGPALAAPLNLSALPAELAHEMSVGDIHAEVVDGAVQSYASRNGVNAYSFDRNGEAFSLISYDILPGSQWQTFSSPGDANDQFLSLGGQFWVLAPQIYVPGDTAEFSLYFDFLTPGLLNAPFQNFQYSTTVVLQPDAMATGTGIYEATGDPDYDEFGTMSFQYGEGPAICVECGFDAEFNLIFMDYSTNQLVLNFDDNRSTLFTGYDSYDFGPRYGWGLDLIVNPVPLPAGMPLLITALAPLLILRRRNQKV